MEALSVPLVHTSAPHDGAGGEKSQGLVGDSVLLPTHLDDTFDFAQSSNSVARTTFHRSAREKLRRAGEVLETLIGSPSEVIFLTGTFPFFNLIASSVVSPETGWIVKRVKNWLRKYDECNYDFYCWERQRNGSLHLHYAVWIKSGEMRERVLSGFHDFWVGLISALSARVGSNLFVGKGGRDWSDDTGVIQAYAQPVHKSVGRYLAKYTSKQNGKMSESFSRDDVPYPTRWWGSSAALKDAVEKATETSRKVYPQWLQAKNAFNRIRNEIDGLQSAITSFYQSSKTHDGESLTIYIGNGLECVKELIRKFSGVSLKSMKEQSLVQLEMEYRLKSAMIAGETMKALRQRALSSASSRLCYGILESIHTEIHSPQYEFGSFLRVMADVMAQMNGRALKLMYRSNYLHLEQAKQDYCTVFVALRDIWDRSQVVIDATKVSQMRKVAHRGLDKG